MTSKEKKDPITDLKEMEMCETKNSEVSLSLVNYKNTDVQTKLGKQCYTK